VKGEMMMMVSVLIVDSLAGYMPATMVRAWVANIWHHALRDNDTL
jgi:hypothetical protein